MNRFASSSKELSLPILVVDKKGITPLNIGSVKLLVDQEQEERLAEQARFDLEQERLAEQVRQEQAYLAEQENLREQAEQAYIAKRGKNCHTCSLM